MISVGGHSALDRGHQHEGMAPFLQPQTRFIEHAHAPCSARIPLWIVLADKCLLNPQGAASLQGRYRGRLTPVVAHEG
jgi:hypothetical protein